MNSIDALRVVFPSQNEVAVEHVAVPTDVDPGQVLVRTDVSMISVGTETAQLTGKAKGSKYPAYPGYSYAGTVMAVGKGVQRFQPGDRVFCQTRHASHVVLREDTFHLLKIPDALRSEDAIFTTLSAVALYSVRQADIKFGESVMIMGAGLVGQLALRLVARSGAAKVAVGDVKADRLEIATAGGADRVINVRDTSPGEVVGGETYQGEGFDVVIDSTGSPEAFLQSVEYCRKGGRVILLGSPHGPVTIDDLFRLMCRRDITVTGCLQPNNPVQSSRYWPWGQVRERELLMQLMVEKKLDVSNIPVQHVSPKDAPQAYAALGNPAEKALSYIIDWSRR